MRLTSQPRDYQVNAAYDVFCLYGSEGVGGVEAVGVPGVEGDSEYEESVDDGLDSLDEGVRVGVVALDQEVGLREGFQLHLQLQLSQSHPNKNLQLKQMNQQNIVVETIINKIICRSRKNSLESIDCRAVSEKSEYSNEQEPFDQEYIIKKSDLRSFVQKIALQNYENNIAIEKKMQENQELKNEAEKWRAQFEHLKKNIEAREQTLKKKLEESESKCLKEKRKREQMEMEVNWSTNKIKDQMREIQKLKHSTVKNTHKFENENSSATHSNRDKQEYVTPGKEVTKKLQNLGIKNCESIDYSLLNSDVVNKFMVDQYPPTIKECNSELSKDGKNERNYVLNSLDNHSSKKGNIEISRFHRHAEIDEKERLLKLLGEKCLSLEAYIEKLTKKYLGEVVYTQQTDRSRCEERPMLKEPGTTNLKVIEQHSSSSLHRSESEVGKSTAFQVQPQL